MRDMPKALTDTQETPEPPRASSQRGWELSGAHFGVCVAKYDGNTFSFVYDLVLRVCRMFNTCFLYDFSLHVEW